MNQILSIEKPGKNKNKKKTSIKSIVIVFSIMLMILGMGMISTGAYSYYKNISKKPKDNLEITYNTKPIITIQRENSNMIVIVASHDKEIKNITYNFENEESVTVNGTGENTLQTEVKLPSGSSTININATDINGITSSYQSSFEAQEKPTIALEQVGTQIQATIESNININTIVYYWDDDLENATTYTINDTKNVTLIDVNPGIHVLTIKVEDVEGHKEEVVKRVNGVVQDKEPEITVTTDGNKFFIEVKDDDNLTKLEYKLNSGEIVTKEINGKEYQTEVDLVQGVNKITVNAYNENGTKGTAKVKHTKE